MTSRQPLPRAEAKVVCRCLGVTEAKILHALHTLPITTLKELRACTGAGSGCMCCHRELLVYLEEHVPAEDIGAGSRKPLTAAG